MAILPEADHPIVELPEDYDVFWLKIMEREKSDAAWWTAVKASDEKFTMNLTALVGDYFVLWIDLSPLFIESSKTGFVHSFEGTRRGRPLR